MEENEIQEIEENNNNVEPEEIKPREMQNYENIESRLKEIEEKVSSGDMDLDDSLDLYEEAVNLGMKASQTIENNVLVDMSKDNEEEESDEDE